MYCNLVDVPHCSKKKNVQRTSHYHVRAPLFTYEPPLERASGTRGAKRTRSCESVSDLTYVYDLSDEDETI